MTTVPSVTLDPRFRAGRKLVQTGRANQGAIDIFETLVQESRREFGDASVQAAACYYEYGNALFRAAARRTENNEEEEEKNDNESNQKKEKDSKPAAVASVETEQNEHDSKPEASKSKVVKENGDVEASDAAKETQNEEEDIDDVELALEMMETAWSVLDKYVVDSPGDYTEWATEQLPRILLGIGDVLSSLNRHADAADAYSRALPHREAALQQFNNDDLTVEHLKRRRQLVEANVLVAEALLACPKDQDVVTTETNDLLVKASERVEYARGYYDKARDELQETVFLMGKIAASGKDLGTEKEDVCFISTMLMAVGTTLAELDEEQQEANGDDSKPPAKKQKK